MPGGLQVGCRVGCQVAYPALAPCRFTSGVDDAWAAPRTEPPHPRRGALALGACGLGVLGGCVPGGGTRGSLSGWCVLAGVLPPTCLAACLNVRLPCPSLLSGCWVGCLGGCRVGCQVGYQVAYPTLSSRVPHRLFAWRMHGIFGHPVVLLPWLVHLLTPLLFSAAEHAVWMLRPPNRLLLHRKMPSKKLEISS